MVAVVTSKGNRQYPFTVWAGKANGGVEIDFEYLKTYAPFREEDLRLALRERLNAISGVHIGIDRIEKRPSIPFSVLRSREAQEQFFSTMQWVIETIRAAK